MTKIQLFLVVQTQCLMIIGSRRNKQKPKNVNFIPSNVFSKKKLQSYFYAKTVCPTAVRNH
jgi:hypothetical protein